MKWIPIESTEGEFDVEIPDKMIRWAQKNNLQVRGLSHSSWTSEYSLSQVTLYCGQRLKIIPAGLTRCSGRHSHRRCTDTLIELFSILMILVSTNGMSSMRWLTRDLTITPSMSTIPEILGSELRYINMCEQPFLEQPCLSVIMELWQINMTDLGGFKFIFRLSDLLI